MRYINYSHYGTFVTDEYNSGSYADAYGALSRLNNTGDSHIVIPFEQREKLYKYSDAFAQLYPHLDAENATYGSWKEVQGEYKSGYFSFVLREAARAAGYFEDAQTANRYFDKLARQTNRYCESLENAGYTGGRRSGIVARVFPHQYKEIAITTVKSIIATAKYTDVSCIPVQCEEDDKYLKTFEEFTNSTVAGNRYMESGEIVENYHLTGLKRTAQRIMRVVIIGYQILNLPLLIFAFCMYILSCIEFIKKRNVQSFRIWIVFSALAALFVLRCFMIAFVHVTTFSAIYTPAYQAGSYVAMGAFTAFSLLYAGRFITSE